MLDRIFVTLQKVASQHANHYSLIKMGVTVLVYEL